MLLWKNRTLQHVQVILSILSPGHKWRQCLLYTGPQQYSFSLFSESIQPLIIEVYDMFFFSANNKCVYTGKDLTCQIFGLHPCSQYTYKLRAFTEGDESPFSEGITIVTEENGQYLNTKKQASGSVLNPKYQKMYISLNSKKQQKI